MTAPPEPVAPPLPAVPLSDTPTQSPLISTAQYQAITGDVTTPMATVSEAVTTATVFACQHCNRTFPFGHYQENLYVTKDGMVYPSASPIAQVDTPTQSDIQGSGVWIGFYFAGQLLPIWTGVVPPQTHLDYWGGYTATTIPPLLARVLARLAWFICNPVTNEGLPDGTKSTNVAGVSISGNLSSAVLTDRQLRKDLARFTKRDSFGWSYGYPS